MKSLQSGGCLRHRVPLTRFDAPERVSLFDEPQKTVFEVPPPSLQEGSDDVVPLDPFLQH